MSQAGYGPGKYASVLFRKTQYIFKRIILVAENVLTAPNDALPMKFSVLLWSFLQ